MRLIRLLLILSVLLIGLAAAGAFLRWPVLAILGFIGLVAANHRRQFASGAFGTAMWATPHELAGMTEGLQVGEVDVPAPSKRAGVKALLTRPTDEACRTFLDSVWKTPRRRMLKVPVVHTSVFAPTGVGKGVSIVVPHLLSCPDSAVVLDLKGELTRITADHRQHAFGHRIVRLDPFRVVGESDSLNPLQWIERDGLTSIDDCRDLAEMLVVRTGEEKEPHWNDNAEAWIAAMCALVVSEGDKDRSLQMVRMLLSEQPDQAVGMACDSKAWGGMLARMGGRLKQFVDKEKGSVLTTANRHLGFLDTPAVAAITRTSSFDPAELNAGKMTVYLILPPERMRAQAGLLRMWIGSMMRAVVKGGLR